MQKTVAIVVFAGVQSLDVTGPMDVFSEANRFLAPSITTGSRSLAWSAG